MPARWDGTAGRSVIGLAEADTTAGVVRRVFRIGVGVPVDFKTLGCSKLDEKLCGHPAVETCFVLLAELGSIGCVGFMKENERNVDLAEGGEKFLQVGSSTHCVGAICGDVLGVDNIREEGVNIFLEVLDVYW